MRADSVFETPHANAIFRSLGPELETPVTERSVIDIRAEGPRLYLSIIADDIISMRSTLNTWLRLIQVASELASLHDEI